MVLLPAAASSKSCSEAFRLVKEDGTLRLYERWTAAGVREIKAVFRVKAVIPAVVALLQNEKQGTSWNSGTTSYKIVRHPGDSGWITYVRYNIPWPLSDQDCCLGYVYRGRDNGGTAELMFESVSSSHFPVYPNITRITGTKGRWILEEQPQGVLQITYFITTDRSKTIPRWVSDPIIHDNLFKTMSRFKGLLEKGV